VPPWARPSWRPTWGARVRTPDRQLHPWRLCHLLDEMQVQTISFIYPKNSKSGVDPKASVTPRISMSTLALKNLRATTLGTLKVFCWAILWTKYICSNSNHLSFLHGVFIYTLRNLWNERNKIILKNIHKTAQQVASMTKEDIMQRHRVMFVAGEVN